MCREHLTKAERVARARRAFSEAVRDSETYSRLAETGDADRRPIFADIAAAARLAVRRWAATLHSLTA